MKKCIFILLIAWVKIELSEGEQTNDQCGLSQLEEKIAELKSLEPRTFLPMFKSIKKDYPGDRFRETGKSECPDIETEEACKHAAELGNCHGTNQEVLLKYSHSLQIQVIFIA